MASHRGELRKVAIHLSLVRPMLLLGGERTLVILTAMVAGYLGYLLTMRFGIHFGLPIGGGLWSACLFVLRRMGAADPQMWPIFLRSKRYKSFYPARGRFDAFFQNYKDFK